MKCPICNAENEPEATACAECGFGLTLSQPAWPEPPTVPRIEPAEESRWPEAPQIEVPDTPPWASWDDEDAVAEFQEQAFTPVEPPPAPSFDQDDQLAEMHIERGEEARAEGLLDQARWEFKQARDVADDQQIIERAEAYLRQLRRPAEPVVDTAPPQERPELPRSSAPVTTPEAMRAGIGLGLLNAILTGLGSAFCLGLLFAPFFGFLAGRGAVRRAAEQGRSASLISAAVVGMMVGLGGWLGEMVGHPIWLTRSADVSPLLSTTLFSSCFLGILYLFLAIFFSVIGGLSGRRAR